MRIRLKLDDLQQLLARSSISQNHWAARLGLSKGHFSNLLSGKHLYPSARTRERMLEVLAVSFDALFEIEAGQELPDFPIQAALRDRYLLDRQIGQGGMGTVYLARALRLGRPVAIKIVNAEVVSGVGSKALLREIINTNRLQHHHILPVLDAGEVDGSPYYVLPYVRGGSLRELLQKKSRLPVSQALSILAGVGSALDHAHALGILHCDVKPANILLSDDHPYLIDFGVARVVQAEVWSGEWRGDFDSGAGTPAYVSPEQARGEQELDGRTDVYSLAGTMYEMLTGRPPFHGDTTLATVAMRFHGDPPEVRRLAPHIPTELSTAIRDAMAIDRTQRTMSAGRLVSDCHRGVNSAGSVVGLTLMQSASPAPTRKTLTEFSLMVQQLRHTWRGIVRAPGVAIAIALTLGLGIGVNAVMFQLIDRLFFKPPAGVTAPEQVKRIYLHRTFLGRLTTENSLSFPMLEDMKNVKSLAGAAGYFPTKLSLDRGLAARRVRALMASSEFFSLLGASPALGRFYSEAEDRENVSGTAVLGYQFWQRHYQGDTRILGRVLRLGSGNYTVVGVAPRGFNGIDQTEVDVFVPLENAAHENMGGPWATSRNMNWMRIVARLSPSANNVVAETEATRQVRAAQGTGRGRDPNVTVSAAPLLVARGPLASKDAQISVWLSGVSLILLVIACANVINLLLTRLTHRESEFAIRAALGSGRRRLVNAVLTEAIMLSLLAGVAGLILAQTTGAVLGQLLLPGVTWPSPVTDLRVVLFTLGIAVAMGVISGVIPAWQGSRTDLASALKSGRSNVTARRSLLRSGLLAFQASLSVVLLTGAGLFVQSMREIHALDSGLAMERLMVASMDLDPGQYAPARAVAMQQDAIARLQQLPGVTAVTGSNSIPFSTSWAEDLSIPGVDSIPTPQSGGPYINVVGSDYFRVVGTRIRAGRAFNNGDMAGKLRVAVVGETMARLIWRDESPLGHCLKIGGDTMPCTEIVGVAADAPRQSLLNRENAQYYVPQAQYEPAKPMEALFIKTSGDPGRLVEPVRRILQQLAPDLAFVNVTPLWELAAPEARSWQLGATLFSAFGVLALIVAALGLYSVVTFDVSRRTKELGIRVALGVTGQRLVRLVFRGGLPPIAAGLVVGVAISAAVARYIQPLLFATNAKSPVVYTVVALVLVASASLAILVPARRATRISPMTALRAD